MSALALRAEKLSKAYRIGLAEEEHDTLISQLFALATSPFANLRRLNRMGNLAKDQGAEDVVWALREVDFEVEAGEVVGVIGRNGAGKSTLLKILSRITRPTSGRAQVRGRIGSLLEVGTGFHPELTGRENVYLNGTILGMSKREIDRKFDEIVAFSEVERFIDTPIKRYSSGMGVRLAFSVAAHLEPEVLLIDEVLAVGDVAFQKKCLGRMGTVAEEGRTVLFVSHNMGAIETLCKRIIVLEEGRLVYDGDTGPGIQHYLANTVESVESVDVEPLPRVLATQRYIKALRLAASDGTPTRSFRLGDDVVLEVDVDPGADVVADAMMSVGIFTAMGQEVVLVQSDLQASLTPRVDGPYTFRCTIENMRLSPGDYVVHLVLYDNGTPVDRVDDVVSFEIRAADIYGTSQLARMDRGVYWVNARWSGQVDDQTLTSDEANAP